METRCFSKSRKSLRAVQPPLWFFRKCAHTSSMIKKLKAFLWLIWNLLTLINSSCSRHTAVPAGLWQDGNNEIFYLFFFSQYRWLRFARAFHDCAPRAGIQPLSVCRFGRMRGRVDCLAHRRTWRAARDGVDTAMTDADKDRSGMYFSNTIRPYRRVIWFQ